MVKKSFYSEIAYAIALVLLALGTALMAKSDLGISMVVAPAYILHVKLSQISALFSFGLVELLVQLLVFALLILILRRFRVSYLLCFGTAGLYGLILDLFAWLLSFGEVTFLSLRILLFLLGMLLCAIGISLFFHTYFPPMVYEQLIKSLQTRFRWSLAKSKTIYDLTSCLLAILLSFAFFGFWHFEGIKAGTLFCALFNGWLIGRISAILDRFFVFRDILPLRKYFEKQSIERSDTP